MGGLTLRRATRNLIPTLIVTLASLLALQQIVTHAWLMLREPTQCFVWSCAGMSLWWTVVAVIDWRMTGRSVGQKDHVISLTGLATTTALLLGVAAAIVLAFVLAVQSVYVLVDLMHGYRVARPHDFGFDAHGLLPIGMLFAACGLGHMTTREARLPACLVGCATLAAIWASLLLPAYGVHIGGAFEPSPSLLVLCGSLSLVLGVSAWLSHRALRQDRSPAGGGEDPVLTYPYPGLPVAFTSLALVVTALTAYQLLVPVHLGAGGEALSSAVLAGSSGLAATASLATLRFNWSPYRADAGITLESLSLCAAATILVPSEPTALGDRYPMIFNAIMIGLIAGSVICVFSARKLRARSNGRSAETFEWRLSCWLMRFAFFNAALAVVAGAMMAIWPKLPTVATMDDSLSRVAVGTATYLLLVLVLIWCARRLRQSSIHGLTILAVMAACAFILVRLLPFASTVS